MKPGDDASLSSIGAIWCVVGNRIGPECLEIALDTSPEREFFVSPTDRADRALVQQILDRSGAVDFTVLDYDEAASHISGGEIQVDWLLNLWGERIVHASVLGHIEDSLNIHPSFLPYGRGSDPIPWAIIRDEPPGVSLHRMTQEVDGGEIWCQRRVTYDWPETGRSLYERVLRNCVDLFEEAWPVILGGQIIPSAQATTDRPARRRAELLAIRRLDEAQLLEMSAMDLVRCSLALDFGDDFHLLVDLGGQATSIRIDPPSTESKRRTDESVRRF